MIIKILILIFGIFLIQPRTIAATESIASSKCHEFTFDASASHKPDNGHLSFHWDFGDGSSATEPIVTHTYQKSGDYKVVLTITDNSGLECSTAQAAQTVRANIPPHAEFSANSPVCTNQSITFDARDSYDDSKSELRYEWDFGDGTLATGKRIVKSFTKGGKYYVNLTVDDNSGAVCSSQSARKAILVNEPPKAEAGDETILKCVSGPSDMTIDFDATHSSDINGDALTYVWDFGDGETKQGSKASHTYSQLGNYDVKLVVKDNSNLDCGTGVDFVTVKLNEAPQADAGKDIAACTGETLIFDGTKSRSSKKGTLSAKWFFGDGQTAQGLKAMHTYNKPGKYQASLSVENQLNAMCPTSTDTKAVTINSPPSVDIKSVDSVCLGNKVFFDASSGGDPDGDTLEYFWTFGDGAILKGDAKVSHEYAQGGAYRVTVVVNDGQKTKCSTATATILVRVNTPPIAHAGQNAACCVDKPAVFDASGSSDPDGDALTYHWDFGDGVQAQGAVVNHSYRKSGAYNVSVTVDDKTGSTCSSSTSGFTAQVNAAPIAVMTIR